MGSMGTTPISVWEWGSGTEWRTPSRQTIPIKGGPMLDWGAGKRNDDYPEGRDTRAGDGQADDAQ